MVVIQQKGTPEIFSNMYFSALTLSGTTLLIFASLKLFLCQNLKIAA